MKKTSKIFVAGHRGLVGSAFVRRLEAEGYTNLVTRTHAELDLLRQDQVEAFFQTERPDTVILAAAKVGGIWGNSSYPAQFIYENIAIQTNIIHASYVNDVNKLLFLGSSCIYPKHCPQPIKEEYLLSDYLESTNEPYAIAKIAGIKLCQAYQRQYGCKFISAMPTNLYGPEDNFDLESSHVMPALIRKFHQAKVKGDPTVTVWGSGRPLREFLHVDDCASACLYLMEHYDGEEIVNIGVGGDLSIADLAALVKKVVGYEGEIVYDASKPDGTPRKLVDVSRINGLGWNAGIPLAEGIRSTYQWFLENEV
mgnify:CR=1 FL=1